MELNIVRLLKAYMKIKTSTAKSSSIIEIGIQLNKKGKEQNTEVLATQRGINSVTHLDTSKFINFIDFNSSEIQNYPPVQGHFSLRTAINDSYFDSKAEVDNIFVTIGSVLSLNLCFSILDVETIYLPEFYWGAYVNILKITNKKYETYKNFEFLYENIDLLKNCAVIISEPNNPLGSKESDEKIFEIIARLNKNNIPIIMDSPYRRVFIDNPDFYIKLLDYKNLILMESFSKYLGISGQRIGFLHSTHKEFNEEFKVRLLYATNGVNGFAQKLVTLLLSSVEGKQAVTEFLNTTRQGISQNINFLRDNNLLAEEFYIGKDVIGIFAVVNKSQDELFEKNIGAVNLSFFNLDKQKYCKYSRICVSVPPDKFKLFFSQFIV